MTDRHLVAALRDLLGPDGVLDDAASQRVYARDASHLEVGTPSLITLPRNTEEVAGIVRHCLDADLPYVARGAGTGLSGGALPTDGAVVISLCRLRDIIELGPGAVCAGPGVTNGDLDRRLARRGGSFAPDPSSQDASTIGGNIAENAGGPHCLKVGTTVRHVRGLTWVDPLGEIRTTGAGTPGWDLTPLLVGSEGTLGVVTAADLVVTPRDEATATLLVYVTSLEDSARAVITLLESGLLPAALEVVDGPMLALVERAFAFGFRTDAAAAMIVEFAGPADSVAADADTARVLLEQANAQVLVAADDQERLALWRCRKRAFGAVGRLSPNYVTMDVAVPVGCLPAMVTAVQEIARRYDVEVATALHAGDGNLHPGVMYDARDEELTRRAHKAADAIIEAALSLNGTVTGEHGVGVEKLHVLPRQLDPVALEIMHGLRRLADPRNLCNPGKLLPGEPGAAVPPPTPQATRFDRDALAVTAPAGATLAEVRRTAAAHGLRIAGADGPDDETLGHAFLNRRRTAGDSRGRLSDGVLQVWARTGDGRALHSGRPVVKNVAGYDLPRLLAGTGGSLVTLEGLMLSARPESDMSPLDRSAAVPSPASWVPRPADGFLEGMKALFDPDGVLPPPQGLEGRP